MFRFFIVLALCLAHTALHAQVLVINELDCDSPGVDEKEFVEIKSQTPNFNLDGYVLVFFNGSASGGNTSYMALDLDGYTTDINGLLLIGSNTVSPFPQYIIESNTIQNGADAVAIYQGSDYHYPEGTLANAGPFLRDVLIYGTADPDAVGLITIFQAFNPSITQINEGPANNTTSIQRTNTGTYVAATPTPRQLNDGSGIMLNGILISTPQTAYSEGQSFPITFTAEQNVTENLTINFTLANGLFKVFDYAGSTTVTIPAGQKTASTTITLVDDTFDEGDEEMLIYIPSLPIAYLSLNNNLIIRAIDNDFTVAPYGTPLNPTFGIVIGTQPNDYYESIEGLSDTNLHNALRDIIANPNVVRAQTYADVIDIVKQADQNPLNSNQVWLVYLEQGRSKLDFQLTSVQTGKWNREHTYPRSRGGFDSIEADTIADGKNIFWNTNADSTRHANSDAHAIRIADAIENSNRSNQFYGQYNGPVGTLGKFKGDVARGIFYLAVRYNGLDVVNGYPEGIVGQFGDLATLLDWHRNDPADDYEMNRNNVVYDWQRNRNPFIDHPELAEYIWGNKIGQVWQQSTSTPGESDPTTIKVYPNPTTASITINGLIKGALVELIDVNGIIKFSQKAESDTLVLPSGRLERGTYVIKMTTARGRKAMSRKVVVE